ncbi:ArnT family glycosyltransferase [Microbacterium elymi]|uniref:Glycosyltransferase family 39 protein n=1 Tax=Microbacterium elymi TaxID=2909587 RepID=A0ABY5NJW2_9MICO|nr:glycosyltransferase family 39 protein [Microbacterium elymi]UUT35458.1 glycosyltransferase family 39 protein [Microbacterium elymi]
MAALSPAAPLTPSAPRTWARIRRPTPWAQALATLGVVSGILTIWGSWAGSRSDYYAAIAVSMSQNWSNFFFGAFDPAGTVTLDKIPGSYWIPALFVKAFGFSTFTVVLPNALAAVAATLLVAVTAKRIAGSVGGVVAGAVVATTPILVAVSRSNQPESFFVLGLALAAWAGMRAIEGARLRWLVLAGVFIAAAFQCYMLEAWAVWPALAAAYLCTRQRWWRRVWHLAVAGALSVALSVAWIATVALIPSGSRPYVGSTLHDSPWEMVFGYNGLGRFGQATSDADAYNSFTPPFSGDAGALRLFNDQLAGQIGWLIPTALAALALLIALRVRAAVWVLLGVWILTFAVMFSAVAGMHQFYTAALAVPMGLAIGVAFGRAHQRGRRGPQIALVAVAAGTAPVIATIYRGYSVPVAVAQAVLGGAAVLLIALLTRKRGRMRWMTASLALVGMLLTPTVWSAVTIADPSSTNPVAGGVSDIPVTTSARARGFAAFGARRDGGRFGGALTGGTDDARLLSFLKQNAGDSRYLLTVFGAQAAAPLIIASGGAAILPVGGFSGNDPVPTATAFTAMVQAGDIRYVLTSGRGGGFGGSGTTTSGQILTWVESHCTSATTEDASGLYDCAPD